MVPHCLLSVAYQPCERFIVTLATSVYSGSDSSYSDSDSWVVQSSVHVTDQTLTRPRYWWWENKKVFSLSLRDLVFPGVPILTNPYRDILGVRFDIFKAHERDIETCVLLRCYHTSPTPVLEKCSPLWSSAVNCHIKFIERQVLRLLVLSRLESCAPDSPSLYCCSVYVVQ